MKKLLFPLITKIFTAVILTILILVLFFNLSTRISVDKIKKGADLVSGYTCVIIASGSMEPAIATNDLLILKSTDSYKPGDVITYISAQGSLITHRIKEVSKSGYITQGDANNIPDDEVPAQRILGKSIFVLSGAGIIMKWILSPINIAVLMCIVILVWLIIFLETADKEQE